MNKPKDLTVKPANDHGDYNIFDNGRFYKSAYSLQAAIVKCKAINFLSLHIIK